MAEPSANTVLQGYLAAQQQALARKQLEQQHDEFQNQLKELHEYHSGELESKQSQLDLQKAQLGQQIKQAFMEQVGSGLISPQGTPNYGVDTNVSSGYNGQDQNGPTQGLPVKSTSFNPSLFHESNTYDLNNVLPPSLGDASKFLSPSDRNVTINTPQQQARVKADVARTENQPQIEASNAIEEGKVRAQFPLKVFEANAAATLKSQEATDAQKLQAQKDLAAGERSRNSAAARTSAAQIQANARRYAADVNGKNKTQVDAGELSDNAFMSAYGLGDLPTGANKIHVQSIQKSNGLVPFTRTDAQKLNGLNDLDGVFEDMRAAAQRLGTTKGGQLLTGAQSHIPLVTTDLQNAMNQVSARAPQVVRNILGVGTGRLNALELQNSIKGAVTGGMTQQQAKNNIDKLERDTYSKIYSDILGSVPSIQQKIGILQTHGVLDKFKKVNITEGGKQIPLIRPMEDGNDGIWDANNKTYVEIKK